MAEVLACSDFMVLINKAGVQIGFAGDLTQLGNDDLVDKLRQD